MNQHVMCSALSPQIQSLAGRAGGEQGRVLRLRKSLSRHATHTRRDGVADVLSCRRIQPPSNADIGVVHPCSVDLHCHRAASVHAALLVLVLRSQQRVALHFSPLRDKELVIAPSRWNADAGFTCPTCHLAAPTLSASSGGSHGKRTLPSICSDNCCERANPQSEARTVPHEPVSRCFVLIYPL